MFWRKPKHENHILGIVRVLPKKSKENSCSHLACVVSGRSARYSFFFRDSHVHIAYSSTFFKATTQFGGKTKENFHRQRRRWKFLFWLRAQRSENFHECMWDDELVAVWVAMRNIRRAMIKQPKTSRRLDMKKMVMCMRQCEC